jgi:hypothetical protein
VWGAIADDSLWEGWLEFLPAGTDQRDAIRTGRETEQPKRTDLMYWAQGLTQVYLEGALQRARRTAQSATAATHAIPTTQERPAESEIRATRSSSR